MAYRMFATVVSALTSCVLTGNANTAEMSIHIDGCAVLARAVHSEVSAAVMYGPGRSGPWLVDEKQDEISVCTTTAKTVSRAFTSAMSGAGYGVYWEGSGSGPGGYCPNGYLSRCHPNRDDRRAADYAADTLFVQEAWSVVSRSIMREMYNPFSGDEVRFRDSDLKLQLGLSLRTINRGARR